MRGKDLEQQGRVRMGTRRNFFMGRVVKHWSSIPACTGNVELP